MRELQDHKVNPANDTLTVSVLDEPGVGCGGFPDECFSGWYKLPLPDDPE